MALVAVNPLGLQGFVVLVAAMARLQSVLFFLLLMCSARLTAGGGPGHGRGGSYGGASSSQGRWGNSWRWRQQTWAPQPEVVVRVENERKDRKDKSKKKKKRSSTSSSSDSASSEHEKKNKKRSGEKRKARKSETLSTQDAEELKEFRRQAEIQKIRDEVLASMPGASAKLAKSGRAATEGNAEPEIFTPKTKKLVQAQTRVLTGEGVCKRLLSDEVSSWEDVHVQLNNRTAADVKTLCGQLCEQAPRTKAECISKIVDSLQGQD